MRHYQHDYQTNSQKAENRTRIVMVLTGVMMVAEIIAGTIFNSMALLVDGWHMGTHMAAFLIALIAYWMARKNRDNPRFSFGTGKIGVLGGFTSSILLMGVAGLMIFESLNRLFAPSPIQFGDALIVAIIGLLVNIASAIILGGSQDHGHSHGSGHHHDHDKNLKAAYVHVITDAFTSVTAIIALLLGYFFGIIWIDAVMGFLGSLVIIAWAASMIRDTVIVLVDYFPKSSDLELEIRGAIGQIPGTTINDLHLWQVASGKFAAIISIEADQPKSVEEYHRLVDMHEELVHISIQVMGKADDYKEIQ